jgi:hypothetical protein
MSNSSITNLLDALGGTNMSAEELKLLGANRSNGKIGGFAESNSNGVIGAPLGDGNNSGGFVGSSSLIAEWPSLNETGFDTDMNRLFGAGRSATPLSGKRRLS